LIEGKHDRVWLNPFRPEVQFIQDLILEIVSKYDIDGIQFDDHFGLQLSWDTMPSQLGNICKSTQGKRPIIPKFLTGCAGELTKLLSMKRVVQAVHKQNCLVSWLPTQRVSTILAD